MPLQVIHGESQCLHTVCLMLVLWWCSVVVPVAMIVLPELLCHRWTSLNGAFLTWSVTWSLRTTVLSGKFFNIPQASFPNSAAHRGKFSIYSN